MVSHEELLGMERNKSAEMASSKAWPISALLLRLVTFIFLVISLIVLATDSFSYPDPRSSSGKTTVRFKVAYAYRYALSVAVIGCAYSLAWIPFAVHHVAHGKPISDGLPTLNLCMDVVIELLLATGTGAGFGLTIDAKRLFEKVKDKLRYDAIFSKIDRFSDRANVSFGFLLIATVAMAALVIGSALSLAKKS